MARRSSLGTPSTVSALRRRCRRRCRARRRPRALLGGQSGQVDLFDGADVGFLGVEPAGQQDFVDQLVQLADVARDLVA